MAAKRHFRIDLEGDPMMWHRVLFPEVDGHSEANICYRVFQKDEYDRRRADNLEDIIRQSREQEESGKDDLVARQVALLESAYEKMLPEYGKQQIEELVERIVDWDIEDLSSSTKKAKLPVTAENIRKLCQWQHYFQSLYEGLMAASGEAPKKT